MPLQLLVGVRGRYNCSPASSRGEGFLLAYPSVVSKKSQSDRLFELFVLVALAGICFAVYWFWKDLTNLYYFFTENQ